VPAADIVPARLRGVCIGGYKAGFSSLRAPLCIRGYRRSLGSRFKVSATACDDEDRFRATRIHEQDNGSITDL
jgi:hypothetical protein